MEPIPFQLQLKCDLSFAELAAVTLYRVTFGARTAKENGIEYLYAWLSKHPDVGWVD